MTTPEILERNTKSCTCCSQPTVINLNDENFENNRLPGLRQNLEKYGWSLIRYNGGNPPTTTWKEERLIPLFHCQESFLSPQYSFQFRTNESGGCQRELKQSWEISFRNDEDAVVETSTSTNALQQQVQHDMIDWFKLFHKIATTVCRHLELPRDILLEEDTHSRRLDLLRAFYYEMAQENNTQDQDDDDVEEELVTLGSNPHSDWGSFTIVWQDSVGGLQAYCQSCQCWSDVMPVPNTFIVHCSDITSLALQGKWPSPMHRVVSPRKERRVSLVYFGYPPSHLSLKDISEGLSSLNRNDTNHEQSGNEDETAYENYSLLQNQSLDADDRCGAKQQYEHIYNLPVQQVVQDKWRQVQRY